MSETPSSLHLTADLIAARLAAAAASRVVRLDLRADAPLRNALAALDIAVEGDVAHLLNPRHGTLQEAAERTDDETLLLALDHSAATAPGYPASADAFITLAASEGLFCDQPPPFERNADGTCLRSVYALSKRGYVVRGAQPSDIDSLDRLENACWIPALRTPRERLLARVEQFPQGQFVLERNGQVKGVIYSQRIHREADLARIDMDTVHQLHDAAGAIVQLLAVNVDPDSQDLGGGDQLLEFMLQRSSLQSGVQKIVAVTLCKDFRAAGGLSFADYVAGVGKHTDRVLHFHHVHGAELAAVLPNYRPRDLANLGQGALVEYHIEQRRQRRQQRRLATSAAPADAGSDAGDASVRRFVEGSIAALIGGAAAFDPTRPLMELGLDSAGLLALRQKLEIRFRRKLRPAFFFTYNTPHKVIDFLCAQSPQAPRDPAGVEHEAAPRADESDVAVIGIGCRLPQGIVDLDGLWEVLDAGRDVITQYPHARGPWPRGGGIERGGFLLDGECFDAPFFRMSAREAQVTDPQQRLLLEVSWRCFEDACLLPAALKGTGTGVFVGASNPDYAHLLQEAGAEVEAHSGVGNSLAMLANRLSYFYDFHGPSLLIDTACSSSLVALHAALQSLRAGECRLALVGGVNFICNPRVSLAYQKAGMLAPDGRCKAFADSANGYVRSEGAIALLLKPLRDAVADGNRIHAILKGSAVNHGGQAAGLTVPNPQKQAALLQSAWRNARIDPRQISYLEAHGTGTSLGDPIEIEGMQSAFAETPGASPEAHCGVGSVKSNIGHLESAAGLAGLLKVIAAMKHRRLPASLHVDAVNSRMMLRDTPLRIQSTSQAWMAPSPRIAGVSSFGSGGANAHVVAQEYIAAAGEYTDDHHGEGLAGNLFVLSAIDAAGLRRNVRAVLGWLEGRPSPQRFTDALYSWQCARTAFHHRLAIHVRDFDELERKLKLWLDAEPAEIAVAAHSTCAVEWDDALARRDWAELARLWLLGRQGEWSRLYASSSAPHFVKLPGYAFSGEPHWIPPAGRNLDADDHSLPTPAPARSREFPDAGFLYATPVWRTLREAPVPPVATVPRLLVLLCDVDIAAPALASALEAATACACRCVELSATGNNAAERYQSIALQCFEQLRELACDASAGSTLIQCVIPNRDEDQVYRGLAALLRTAAMEQSRLVGQVIGIDDDLAVDALAMRLHSLRHQPSAMLVRCGRHEMQALDWQPLDAGEASPERVYKDDGVYVITGGTGALGLLFAQDIVEHCSRATVILTGRAAPTESIAKKVAGLQRAQNRVVFRQLDLLAADDVEAFVGEVAARYRSVNGIIHCAGMIADRLITKKTAREFQATLQPKVLGTYLLDRASQNLALDFFVVFSSIASAIGSIGQSDYAAANGFMDHFIHYRRELARQGRRSGASVSINWPYWQAGGMRIDATTQKVLQQNIGMQPMATGPGLQALHRAVGMNCAQLLVAQGDPGKLLARLRGKQEPGQKVRTPAASLQTLEQIQTQLRQMLGVVLRARPEDIEVRKPLVELGLDSLLGTEFVSAINQRFSTTLSSVGIYDHPNVAALAQYIDAAHRETAEPVSPSRRDETRGARATESHLDRQKIAVIGMSGRYPQAGNLAEYWANLAAAKNSIGDMPRSRWDVDAYYDADPDAEGRMYCKRMGVLDDVDCFDPRFFRITPQEALYMDPEQRLFLQEGYRALEDAGYAGADSDGLDCGVYLGMESSEYSWHFAGGARVSETITGNHSAIAAARLAYFMNLKGPALAVDTACSSSLVATHLACQALRSGEVDLALAGGVRLWLSPVMHIGMCKARMLSPSGQCRTFDDAADGIVMGEGVGAVVLKRLSDAERDGDHIYGVILASAINQDGKTNGITAPSIKSQIELERRLYREHDIEPDSISYIEAHGTGTKLGDPIELNALATVFKERTQRTGFCALGSVKTNIGHTGAAAGIAGLHKVLLCLRHRRLVPTLNVENPNRHFDFDDSPFYVNRDNRHWQPAPGATRRACVSSFGFSGTNAHLVVEEYSRPAGVDEPADAEALLIALSARNEAQLKRKARDLLNFIEHYAHFEGEQSATLPSRLRSLAYTLQVGRAAMEERAAFVVRSLDELKEALRAIVDDAGAAVAVQRGRCTDGDEHAGLWNSDADLELMLDKWLQDGKVAKLSGLWVKGVELDWCKLYGARPPARMSLPTYPFAEEKFWVDRRAQSVAASPAEGPWQRLHPLVHRNVSDLRRQAYRSRFSGKEFFLSDHRINSVPVLPGVAYLEAVRAALGMAMAMPAADAQYVEFRDHTWIQPVLADEPIEITVVLSEVGDQAMPEHWIDYEILSEGAAASVVHCRGAVRYGAAPALETIGIDALSHRFGDGPLDGEALYPRFAALGLNYGASLQGIVRLARRDDEVLAHLRLPDIDGSHTLDYGLHPAIMDAAMQSTICLLTDLDSSDARAVMPFSFDSMQVHARTSDDMLAWIRLTRSGAAGLGKIDLDLMDRGGKPCVQIRGLVTRAIADRQPVGAGAGAVAKAGSKHAEKPKLRALLPIWNPVRFAAEAMAVNAGEKCLLLGGDEQVAEWLRGACGELEHWQIPSDATIASIETRLQRRPFDHLLWFAPGTAGGIDTVAAAQDKGVLPLFRVIKALTQLDYLDRELKFTVVTSRTQQVFATDVVLPHHAGVHGLVGSVARELPLWRVALLDLESIDHVTPREIIAAPDDGRGMGLAHRDGEWYRQEFADLGRIPAVKSAYRRNGVYVVIGGAGGLGEVWTRHVAQRCNAQVIWIGRRPLDAQIEAKLAAIAAVGKRPVYLSADAGDEAALATAVRRIAGQFPAIHGVVHSALVLQDQGVRAMEESAFRRAFAAKVDVSVNLEKAFRDHDLDFMLFFSSLSSFHRAAGQSNYSAGCTFKDSFAHSLRATHRYPVKVVNWGYWGSVGVVTDEFYKKRMEKRGLGSIEPGEAMQALEEFVASELNQLLLVKVLAESALAELRVSEQVDYYADGGGQESSSGMVNA